MVFKLRNAPVKIVTILNWLLKLDKLLISRNRTKWQVFMRSCQRVIESNSMKPIGTTSPCRPYQQVRFIQIWTIFLWTYLSTYWSPHHWKDWQERCLKNAANIIWDPYHCGHFLISLLSLGGSYRKHEKHFRPCSRKSLFSSTIRFLSNPT